MARAQRLEQRFLVDQLAARRVDESGTRTHLREGVRVDGAAGLVREREMKGQEVGGGENLVHPVRPGHPELAKAILGDERVVRDHLHPETHRTARDLLADPSEAEHAQRLALELDPAVARAFPPPLLERGVRLRDVPRECDEQPHGVLRRRDDCRLGGIRDDDPAARRGVDVDVVDPHSRPSDHLQPVGPLEDLGGQLRRGADDDRVVVPDPLLERQVAVDVDVELLPQELDSGLGDRLPNEDPEALGHTRVCSNASSAAVIAAPRSMSAPSSASTSSTPASAVVMSKTS